MKLFSIVGTFNILALNPYIHFGMLVAIKVIDKDSMLKLADDNDEDSCIFKIRGLANQLYGFHIFAFVTLMIFHLLKFYPYFKK
jgi:hypothetical protein